MKVIRNKIKNECWNLDPIGYCRPKSPKNPEIFYTYFFLNFLLCYVYYTARKSLNKN